MEVDIYPLTPSKIRAVAALMKAAKYRSCPSYISHAKQDHISRGFEWTDLLGLTVKQCTASTQRGIGPARQAMEFPVSQLAALHLGSEAIVENGPVNPGHWAIICTFHLLRGGESACALASHLTISESCATESLRLCLSKTDTQALGCTRTWGCVCPRGSDTQPYTGSPPCPFHSALAIRDDLHRRFAVRNRLPATLPLFPTDTGEWCSREGFVNTMRSFAERLQMTTVDDLGRDVVGEHVWRVSGARHLAALNLPRVMIKLLARWGGETIDRYIQDAPLRALTDTYKAVQASPVAPAKELLCPKSAIVHLTSEAIRASGTPDLTAPACDTTHELAPGRFVYNPKMKTVHMVKDRMDWTQAAPNRTACGRQIQHGWDPPSDTIPDAVRHQCRDCAPSHVWLAALEDPSDSE